MCVCGCMCVRCTCVTDIFFLQLNLQGLENLDPSLVSAPTKTVLSYLKARLTNVRRGQCTNSHCMVQTE